MSVGIVATVQDCRSTEQTTKTDEIADIRGVQSGRISQYDWGREDEGDDYADQQKADGPEQQNTGIAKRGHDIVTGGSANSKLLLRKFALYPGLFRMA